MPPELHLFFFARSRNRSCFKIDSSIYCNFNYFFLMSNFFSRKISVKGAQIARIKCFKTAGSEGNTVCTVHTVGGQRSRRMQQLQRFLYFPNKKLKRLHCLLHAPATVDMVILFSLAQQKNECNDQTILPILSFV
jgi:hypothetical protein